jgi:uncharacterized radical SAM superfamily Fe-S cluster-containing enzyme
MVVGPQRKGWSLISLPLAAPILDQTLAMVTMEARTYCYFRWMVTVAQRQHRFQTTLLNLHFCLVICLKTPSCCAQCTQHEFKLTPRANQAREFLTQPKANTFTQSRHLSFVAGPQSNCISIVGSKGHLC